MEKILKGMSQMAIKTREEIITSLTNILGEDTSDEALELLTDVRDTLGNQTDAQKITELENQLKEQDATWRKKYRDAFLSGADESFEEEQNKTPKKFEDLFKTE